MDESRRRAQNVPPVPAPPNTYTPPPLPVRAFAAMTAAARFALGGLRVLSNEDQRARAAVCDGCPHRKGDQCTACGCVLSIKTWMPAEPCPHDLWPK